MANVNIKVGYSIDKSGLNELEKILDTISVQAKLPGQEMNTELQKAATTARQLSGILDKSFNRELGTINVTKFNQELLKTHLDMTTIKKDLQGVAQGSTAFNILSSSVLGTTAQIKTANQALEKMAITLKNTIRYGISSSIFNNFANSFQKAYDYAKDLNKSLNDIRIVTDFSAEKMEKFAVHANEASKRLGASTLDYTNAALIYYQQGLSDQEAKARAEVTIKAANVTGQTGQEVSEQLTAVWNGYKVSAEEAELYIDKLAAVAAGTAADLEELSTGMSKVASAANIMGVDVDQLNAQLATIVSVTRQAPESVGVALKTIYARMSDIKSGLSDETTLGNYTEKMAAYGINVLDANNNLRDMGEVIEEIGGKWNSMSREQQVALSQVMAGTRQYNNLLSLFDNWDMYTKSLEMSANAAGTLQEQQDIYMQSTEAHLKELKATWEDLYDSAINDDEINGGIDLLRNLVQTFDNFIDSFGGGVKALGAFGTVFANVFNKQISGAIANFIENQSKMEQNIALLEKKRQTIETGAATSGLTQPGDQAELANVQTQLKYAERIQEVEAGISQEQYNQLTNLQVQMGELEKQAVLLEQEAEAEMQRTLGAEQYQEYLNLNLQSQEEIDAHWSSILDKEQDELAIRQDAAKYLEEQIKFSQKMELTSEEIAEIQEEINGLIGRSTKELGKELKEATKNVDFNKATLKQKEKILNVVKKIVKEQEEEVETAEKNAAAAEKQRQNKEAAAKLRGQEGQLEVEFDDTMSYAERASGIAERVMAVSGALSSLAISWSSINSMFQVWTDENASLSDKITQTVMTLSMAIPGVISAYKSLLTAQQMINAAKAKQNALDAMEATLRTTNLAGLTEEQIIEQAQAILKEKNVTLSEAEIAARLQSIGLLKAETTAQVADTAAKGADAAATGTATAAQWGFNAAIMANPLVLLVTALVGAVAIFSVFSAAAKKAREAQKEMNEEAYKAAVAEKEEAQERKNNADNFLALYKQYQEGTKSKDDLAKATDSLTKLLNKEDIEVAKLTGNYENLIDKIKQARKEALGDEIRGLENEKASAEELMKGNAYDAKPTSSKNGYLIVSGSGNHGLAYGDEFSDKDFSQWLADQGYYDFLTDVQWSEDGKTYTRNMGIRTKEDAESMAKLKGYWDEYVKATNDKDSKYHVSTKEKADSEMYQSYKKFFDAYSGDLENYEKAKKELSEKQAEQQVYNTDFSKVDNIKDYANKRDTLREQLKKSGMAEGKSDTEINNEIDKYAAQFNDNINSIIQKTNTVENAYNHLKETIKDSDLKDNLATLSLNQVAGLTVQNADQIKAEYDALREKGLGSADAIEKLGEKYKILGVQVDSIVDKMGEDNLKGLGLDSEELKDYSKHLIDVADNTERLDDAMEDNDAAAVVVAKSIMRMNNGIEKLNKSQEDWIDILKKSSIESEEYFDALSGLRDAIGDLFDLSEDTEKFLDGDFFKKNAKLIKQAAEGSADAIDELRNVTTDAILVKILIDNEFDQSQVSVFQAYLDDLQKSIPSIKVGTELSLDGMDAAQQEFFNKCQQIVNAAGMTADQASAFFESMGFEAQFETEQKPIVKQGHGTRTITEMKPPMDVKMPDGSTMTVPSGWETKTYPGEPYTYVDYVDAIAMTTDGTAPKIKSITKKGTGSFNNFSSSNKGGPSSPGKSGGGGGGNSKEPDKMDPVEKEVDRYHDVDIRLKQISTDLDKLDKQRKKLFGQDLINNLNKRLGLLNKQIDTTNEKIRIAQGETQELRDKLGAKGVSFNADGTIANYAQAYASQLNYVNSIVAKYNSMSAEAQEGFKDTVEKAKEDFDKFVDNIDRYDELITDMIPGLEADIQEAVDEKIDLQIEKFDMEIELRLDLAEAERDWNEFKKKIIDGIEDDDILGNAMARLVDFSSYYKEDNTGIVQALRKQVDNTLAELNQMDTNGWSNVYGDNRTAALDDLKKYYEELMSNLTDVLELQKEIHESYIDMMDEAQEKFDEQIEAYEMISDLIEHDMEVISLVYGEQSYSQLAKYYDKQQQNFNNQLDFQRQQADFWRQQLDTLEEGSDEWENAREKWADAVQSMNDLIEESIQNLQDKYLNAINLIFQNLNNKITDNLGLEYIEEEWNLINKNADQYLDTINSLYEVQKLEGKYLDALDQTDSISAQRQLKKIMDEELADLRERDKLTQYDIERANKKYEIALKQIALQEAQQNKSKMRLRRDSQGNYRYEYTADGDQIGQLQDELNDMYNSLYNFDKARYQDNLNQMYDVWVEFQEKMAEAAQINDPVARSERELLLQSQYEQLINGLTEQNTTVRNNLHESAFDDLSRLYDIDVANFQNMSDEEKDVLMGDLLPYWESGVQHMTDVFAGEGGFLGVCKDAFDQLHDATKDYEDGLDELENTGRIDFESIGEGIDENINRTQQLISDNTELINSYEQELIAIGNVITQLDDLVNKYNAAKDAAIAATKAAYEYWSEQQRQAAAAAGNANGGSGSGNGNSGSGSGSSGSGAGGGSALGGDNNLVVGETATYSGKYYYDSYGSSPTGSKYSGVANGIVVDRITNNPYGIHIHSADGRYRDLGWVKKSQLSGYDTGGYTGEWGSDGRLALLHQKELVLNKEDTANMLNAISIMRNITNMLGSSVLGKLAAATAGGLGTEVGGDVLEQNVHIDAQFPNVKDSREIEEALNNLVNMASMRANRR